MKPAILALFCSSVLCAAEASASRALYSAAYFSFDVDLNPAAVVLADFNGDSIADVATINQHFYGPAARGTISVRLGNGDGTFDLRRDFEAGDMPNSLAAADVNGDGRIDLVTSDEAAASVFLGCGDGTFDLALAVDAGPRPSAVQVADLDRDGRLDLAFANGVSAADSTGSVTILLGNGDGKFHRRAVVPSASAPILLYDLDGDGAPDLVHTVSATAVAVRLGKGDGTFADTPLQLRIGGWYPTGIVAGDFDRNGGVDLAVAFMMTDYDYGPGGISVFLHRGDGGFGPAVQTWITESFGQPGRISVGLLDGDAIPDLATGFGAVLLGRGDGTFRFAGSFNNGIGEARTPVIADIDGNDRNDVISAQRWAHRVLVALGNGDGTFGSARHFPVGEWPQGGALGDVNGDGRVDILVPYSGNDEPAGIRCRK